MIEKVKRGLSWLFENPEFLFSAWFGALAIIVPGLMFKAFFVVLIGQELYKAYLKERNNRLQATIHALIKFGENQQQCITDMSSVLFEKGLHSEAREIFTKYFDRHIKEGIGNG